MRQAKLQQPQPGDEEFAEISEESFEVVGAGEEEEEEEDTEDGGSGEDDLDDEFTSEPQRAAPLPPTEVHSRRGPTTQELQHIREASDLFKSNTFKLKIDAFLPTLRPSESKKTVLDSFLHTLRTHILSLPSIPPTHPLQAQALPQLHGVRVPYCFPRPAQEVNWKVRFDRPTEIHVIGSWATRTAVAIPGRAGKGKREWGVDLGIVMPAAMFEKKDYLSARLFHKRAFYLAVVAASIGQSELGVEVRFECPNGDERQTRAVLRAKSGPTAPFSSIFVIHIHLMLPRGDDFPFPVSHLSPGRASLHTSATSSPPTPLYNSLILSASLPLSLLVTVHQFTTDIPAYRDALALLRAWASRRGFDRSGRPDERSVLGFEGRGAWWALLLGGCVQGWEEIGGRLPGIAASKSRLARGMSSYQLFRGALDFLQSWDWELPVFMKTRSGGKDGFPLQEWKLHHECIFVEGTGHSNILSGVPRASLNLLRHEAGVAMKVLDDDSEDAFDALFLRDLSLPLTRFDATIRVDISGALPIADIRSSQLDHSSQTNALVHSIQSVVKLALSTRAKCVVILQTPAPDWETTLERPSPSSTIDIGIIFEPGQFSRLVDHGPPADDTEGAAAFRELWGDKSELRRFKDGSITECVVWEAESHEDRANIPSRLVAYILGKHLRIAENAITLYQPMCDQLLQLPLSAVQAITRGSPSEVSFRTALQTYDQLVRELKAIEDFPLSLLNVSAAAEGLRYTSTFPPLSLDTSHASSLPDSLRHIPAQDIILEFEASTKWPDDLEADQKIKLAFFEEIAGKLKQRLPDAQVKVVLDPPPTSTIEDNCLLEVIMPNGIAVHARIYHNRERTLLERLAADRTKSESDRKRATGVLQRFNERFVEKPRHHAAIATLHHKFSAYSQTVRLTKRWLAAHLQAPHVPTELVELLCAHLFLSPGPWAPPASLLGGFLRVLHLLSIWRWAQEPLLVPLYASKDAEHGDRVHFSKEKRDEALEAFRTARSTDPSTSSRAWFVATEEDVHGLAWGKDAPSALICRRITQLAKTHYQYVEAAFETNNLQIRTLFNPAYEDYDFVLHLNSTILPRLYQGVQADEDLWLSRMKFRNLPNQELSVYGPAVKANLDPADLFFHDLRRIYGDICVFFYDPLGGEKIAGIWNPAVLKPTPFKVLLGYSSKPAALATTDGALNGSTKGVAKSKPLVTLNQDAILNEIAALGNGLITTVSAK
ncbi:Nrap protein [Calocera viscosa TUFC12733]|uniref:U3 small nucleolar RNA-associated protein 22 n=1 Tax=Calocera viscosa (strain TUFC12733) TaxID=1330018 RepID=A0A167GJG0_CALVF|nr:Nrap protein [Calocera viscosa TUFC12733]